MALMTADARARRILEWVRADVERGRSTPFEPFEAQEEGLGSEGEVIEGFILNVERGWLTGSVTVLCPNGHNLGEWPVTSRDLHLPDDECSMCTADERQPSGEEELFFHFQPSASWLEDMAMEPRASKEPSAQHPLRRAWSRGELDVRAGVALA